MIVTNNILNHSALNNRAPLEGNRSISIVITAFNQHTEFLNTVAGIAVQVEKNPSLSLEFIVVDNGSVPFSGIPYFMIRALRNET